MQQFLKALLSDGEAEVERLCSDGVEETLHIEFKAPRIDGSRLDQQVRDLIAKSICGFANAEGGTLVLGIRTRKKDGIDIADRPEPIAAIASFRNRVEAALPELIVPAHTGLRAHGIHRRGDQSSGYLAIEVPASDDRPHMSAREHLYYRRGSDRTRKLEHAEIRELFFYRREARLEVAAPITQTHNEARSRRLHVDLILKNVGAVAARNGFVRLRSENETQIILGNRWQGGRSRPDGSFMFPCPDKVLHAGDLALVSRAGIMLAAKVPPRYAPDPSLPRLVLAELRTAKYWEFRQPDGHGGWAATEGIDVTLEYGAENAVVTTCQLRIACADAIEAAGVRDADLEAIFGLR